MQNFDFFLSLLQYTATGVLRKVIIKEYININQKMKR